MPLETNFSMHKLAAIKAFLLNKSFISAPVQALVESAASLGEIWCVLFSNNEFELAKELREQGILPTADEMGQLTTNLTGWYWLSKTEQGKLAFANYFSFGIKPKAANLSVYDNDNCNVWRNLLTSEIGLQLVQDLLTAKITPDISDLANPSRIDNTNAWYDLAKTLSGRNIFSRLLLADLIPQAEALGALNRADNTNTWHVLTHNAVVLGLHLLELAILPKPEDLSARSATDKTNAWHGLFCDNTVPLTNYHIQFIRILLEKNINPQSSDLEIPDNSPNNATRGSLWYRLLREQGWDGAEFFLRLLDKGIKPTLKDLGEYSSRNSVWHLLISTRCKGDLYYTIFLRLLDFGLIPTPSQLALAAIDRYEVRHFKKYQIGSTIIKRIKAYQYAYVHFNLPPANLITDGIFHQQFKEFYALLFLINLNPLKLDTGHYMRSINRPLEIYILIGNHITPSYFTSVKDLQDLRSEENRLRFAKFYIISAIDDYLKNKLFDYPNERMSSILQAVQQATTYNQLRTIITQQLYMARHPGVTFKAADMQNRPNHAKPFSNKQTQGRAIEVLKNACTLFPFREPVAKYNPKLFLPKMQSVAPNDLKSGLNCNP